MANDYQSFGQAKDHVWGADAAGADYGEVQRVGKANRAKQKELRNRFGNTVGTTFYDPSRALSVTVLIKKNKQLPKPGEIVNYDGKRWQVEGEPKEDQSNEDYRTATFDIVLHEHMNL